MDSAAQCMNARVTGEAKQVQQKRRKKVKEKRRENYLKKKPEMQTRQVAKQIITYN